MKKEQPIAKLIIRNAGSLSPELLARVAEWLDGQKETILLESDQLTKVYTANFWRAKS